MPIVPPGKSQFNVYLPEELVQRTKHAAVDAGTSLSAFVEQVLRRHFDPDSE